MKQCSICLLDLDLGNIPLDLPCHSSLLCYPCWLQHLHTQTKILTYRAGSPIPCPVCEHSQIPISQVVTTVTPSDLSVLQEQLLKVYLRQTQDIERCPLSTCSYAFLPEKCFMRGEQSCPVCYTALHKNYSLSLTPIITFIYMTFMTNNCPKCEIPIDRISGCYHMTCSCGHEFCWYCLKDYRFNHDTRYKEHNQKDCLFLLIIKVFILLLCLFCILLVSNGSKGFSGIMDYILTIFMGVLRTVAVDGGIAIQFAILNHNRYRRSAFKKLLYLFLGLDLVTLVMIHLVGDLAITMFIIGVSLVIGGVSMGLGVLVEFSVSTWFNYIR